ncbi:leucine-rich repeat-containing G-protein coupled receptor 4-like [Topomyia yanbarensis]|uniref:leucine-rich repeat-containing G-protein coupled receptor 4-like n=1 Tax=Topomyia yanbarensis TaxID=2498891 RepID=UPI00273BA599|nr:leucine-rich repeat-containing G-protein coupled receptor 4-like [Topomyia yanbarensis]
MNAGALKSIIILLLGCLAQAAVEHHTCIPTSYTSICILEYVYYSRNDTTTHVFPKGHSHVRIGSERWFHSINSIVREFDTKLYNELDRPQALEVVNSGMTSLEIPRALEYANFADNSLKEFSIESGAGETFLTFLDLSSNALSNLTNISSLVNLESLYLSNNEIQTLEPDVFKQLTQLKVLELNQNKITSVPENALPRSLSSLGLFRNQIRELKYNHISLPSLEVFNIESNHLETFDAAALLLAMPKLRIVRFGGNKFDHGVLRTAIVTLQRYNISYRNDFDDSSCYYDRELVDGVCMRDQYWENGWAKATGLSILAILVAVLFVLVSRWIFIAMNR